MSHDFSKEDTIAAIATPLGLAGVGIVRLSGPLAISIAEKIFLPIRGKTPFQSHRLYLGHLFDPATEEPIDEVLLSCMKTPHSYTREDVVEINSHSGYHLLSTILQITVDEGARLAQPGEFTYRAYMNGRIDLTQAEAIVDLVNARSERGLQLASYQLKGALRNEIEGFRQELLNLLARVEVAIDFPDEAEIVLPEEDVAPFIQGKLIRPIKKVIRSHPMRDVWIHGVKTTIVGSVNSGKSSLLNRLSNEERAIVTDIPGTTRDIVESTIHIEGLPLRLMDTAGIRNAKDKVEEIGLEITRRKLDEADLVLIVLDISRPLHDDDRRILSLCREKDGIILLNKIDLPAVYDASKLRSLGMTHTIVEISALTGEGIEKLERAILDTLLHDEAATIGLNAIPNIRQKNAFVEASRHIENSRDNIRNNAPLDIIAEDLQCALHALEEITGDSTPDEILEKIFGQFCIGK
jgi:tRNA modification GTPase